MKNLVIFLAFALFATGAQATSPIYAEPLDGMKFCRTMSSDGLFGQPEGDFIHCVSFEAGWATDNANSFFGNAPEGFDYSVWEDVIFNLHTGKATEYKISDEGLVMVSTGVVLRLAK